jgi:cobalt-zinc-cadmium efflux system protein
MTKGHKHDDHEVATPDGRYLAIALGLICCLMVGEVIAAALSGSLALFADAGHLLTDVGGWLQACGQPAWPPAPRKGSGPSG